jgi:repressor LexA
MTENTKNLTDRQEDALLFLRLYIEEHGWAPTMREMAVGMGFKEHSTFAVKGLLDALEAKGHIKRKKGAGSSRAISLVKR